VRSSLLAVLERQLIAELLHHPFLQPQSGLLIDRGAVIALAAEAQSPPQLIFGKLLHAHEHAGLAPSAAGPDIHKTVNALPATQVEVSNAEVGPLRNPEHSL